MSYFAILQISCKMEHNCKIKLNIFEKQTAYLNDFTKHPVPRRIKYRWPRNVSESQGKPCKIYNREDHHTFQRLKEDKHVPFDLWWKRKPITRTDPRHKFQLPEIEDDPNRNEVIKTRPRLYISPAVCLDDIPSTEMRDMICKDTYLTDWRKSEQEVIGYIKTTKLDIMDNVLSNDRYKIELKFNVFPPVKGDWRNFSREWDSKQRRSYVDTTADFWKHRDVKHIPLLQNIVPQHTKEEIADLIVRNNLRTAHDVCKPGYSGYKVQLAKGISLERRVL